MFFVIDYSEFCNIMSSLSPHFRILLKYLCLAFLVSVPISFFAFIILSIIKKMRGR